MRVDTPGDRSQDSQHSLTVAVKPFLYARRAVQATSNLAPKEVGVLVRMACRALAQARKPTNRLGLIKRDEGVNIVYHVAVLNSQGADGQRMLRKLSPNDREQIYHQWSQL